MPRKPRAPTPKGVPWNPDIYEVNEFVNGLNEPRTRPDSTVVPRFVLERLAGLAGIADNGIFLAGIRFSLKAAHRDFPLLSSPVYRGKLVER